MELVVNFAQYVEFQKLELKIKPFFERHQLALIMTPSSSTVDIAIELQ